MKYKGFLIDEEKENLTGKQIFTVWEPMGVYWLGTFNTEVEAKRFVDNDGEKKVAKIRAMRSKHNR